MKPEKAKLPKLLKLPKLFARLKLMFQLWKCAGGRLTLPLSSLRRQWWPGSWAVSKSLRSANSRCWGQGQSQGKGHGKGEGEGKEFKTLCKKGFQSVQRRRRQLEDLCRVFAWWCCLPGGIAILCKVEWSTWDSTFLWWWTKTMASGAEGWSEKRLGFKLKSKTSSHSPAASKASCKASDALNKGQAGHAI